jgi:NAD-dependent dihydropyrimidine dehydrogenase PreA subunit
MKPKSAEETYHGVPRSKIPWGPAIDYEKCISCGKCVDYCHRGVYESVEENGKKKSVVKKPTSCVVFCTGCQDICPVHAITHPSKKETRDLILKHSKTKQTKRRKAGKLKRSAEDACPASH